MSSSRALPFRECSFFMDLKIALSFPGLLCGCLGDKNLCKKPQCLEKSENALSVSCGPPLDHKMSGIAVL